MQRSRSTVSLSVWSGMREMASTGQTERQASGLVLADLGLDLGDLYALNVKRWISHYEIALAD